MATQPRPLITPEQYLEAERQAEFKSEYFDGEVYAMAGAREVHNILSGAAVFLIYGAFRNRNCQVYGSDMRVCVLPEKAVFTYPDVSAVCGEPRFLDGEMDTLLNPVVIIEVLSRSTERYDRERKFQRHKGIASFKQYVLIASQRVQVEVFTRDADGRWALKTVSDPSDMVELSTIDCSFTVEELYEKTGLLLKS